MAEKIKQFLKENICYIIVVLVSLIYVASGLVRIGETGKTISEIIADGVVSLLLGFFLDVLFDLQGLSEGERDIEVQKVYQEHGKIIVEINPYIDKLDDWCEKKNINNLRMQRLKILSMAGLKYDDVFDNSGVAKPFIFEDISLIKDKRKKRKKLKEERRRYKCYLKAVNLKIKELSAGVLTSEGNNSSDLNDLGRTKQDYERKSSTKSFVSKVGTGIIFGYFGIELIMNPAWEMLIWRAFQLALFLVMGLIRLYSSRMFMTDEFKGRMIKKTNHLKMFGNEQKENKLNTQDNELEKEIDENKKEKGENENVNQMDNGTHKEQ